MSIETFLKMHQSFSEVIQQMEAKGLIRKADGQAIETAKNKTVVSKSMPSKKK